MISIGDTYAEELELLLETEVEVLRERCQRRFNSLGSRMQEPLIVWGCGSFADGIATILIRNGYAIEAFVDSKPELWGTVFHQRPVFSPNQLREGRLRGRVVIVGVFTNGPIREKLIEWRCDFLTYAEFALAVHGSSLFFGIGDPSILRSAANQIRAAFSLWSDDASRREYVRQLTWRASLDYAVLPLHLPASETYFPKHWIKLGLHEHFVDCGAYDGDTIRNFLGHTGGDFDHITALEPNSQQYLRLLAYAERLAPPVRSRMHLANKAVGAGHSMTTIGEDRVEVVPLDTLADGVPVTFIKMDIEGFELSAVAGAKRIIQEHRPTMAICVYHAYDHLWNVANLIHSTAPDYSFFLGRHNWECWELVCYAVPKEQEATEAMSRMKRRHLRD